MYIPYDPDAEEIMNSCRVPVNSRYRKEIMIQYLLKETLFFMDLDFDDKRCYVGLYY